MSETRLTFETNQGYREFTFRPEPTFDQMIVLGSLDQFSHDHESVLEVILFRLCKKWRIAVRFEGELNLDW